MSQQRTNSGLLMVFLIISLAANGFGYYHLRKTHLEAQEKEISCNTAKELMAINYLTLQIETDSLRVVTGNKSSKALKEKLGRITARIFRPHLADSSRKK